MLHIKKIKLENFQKHDNLTLDLVNGVNVLHGKSRSGKSCVRRAIEWVIENKNIASIRKQNTKKTTVTITFSTDIEVSKIRSESINRYVLKKGEEEKVFDSVGRNIPEEVQQAIKLAPITIDNVDINLNVAKQITLPFLLDQSASFRMKLFNKLTGNDLIDKVLVSLNKDILKCNKGIKASQENIESYGRDLNNAELDKMEVDCIVDSIREKLEKAKEIEEKLDELDKINSALKRNYMESSKIEFRDVPKIDFIKCQEIANKISTLSQLNQQALKLKKIKEDIINVEIPAIDWKLIDEKLKLVEKLRGNEARQIQIDSLQVIVKDEIDKNNNELKATVKECKDLLAQCEVCPTCGKEL